MKRKLIPTLLATAAIPLSLFLISNGGGPQLRASGSPLSSGKTCAQAGCHAGTVNSGSGNLSIGGLTEYTPGEDYTITVAVNDEGSSKFGYQAIALDADDKSVGVIIESMGDEIQTVGSDKYVQHSSAASSGAFSFKWTAPSSDVGDITFYAAGNASNSDNATSGDNIYSAKLTVEATEVGISSAKETSFKVFPNPSTGNVTVDFGDEDVQNIEVFNMAGALVHADAISNATNVQIENLETGVYLLKATTPSGQLSEKLIVE